MEQADLSARQALDMFLEMIAAERGASVHTLSAYRSDIERYCEHLAGQGDDILSVNQHDIGRFVAELVEKGEKNSTIGRRLSSVRQFHRFLCAEGQRATDPAASIQAPRRDRAPPGILSVAQVDRLLAAARQWVDEESGPAAGLKACRTLCLLEMLYGSGLRISELVTLPASVAAMSDPYITVRGKGGRERLVPISAAARAALRRYRQHLQDCFPALRKSAWLFPARSQAGHLPRQVFARDLRRLAAAAGLDSEKVSPHALRHAFASHLLQNGADLRVVQELLGHADIATTQIYTHVLDERVQAMVRDLHPLTDGD